MSGQTSACPLMDGVIPRMLSGIAALPSPLLRSTVNALPQDTKDQMVAFLINRNGDRIIPVVQNFAENQGIGPTVTSLSAEP